MPLEIEAKMKVSSHDAVRARLVALGAACAGDVLEVNTFFDTADSHLRSADMGLRLRSVRDAESRDRGESIVTFKGPAQPGELKARQEIETGVTDPAAIAEIFTRLGYAPRLIFEKKRQTWRLQGCTIELDELPLLGCFVEIEGPGAGAIESVRQALGLSAHPLIRPGYAALLQAHLDEQHISDRHIRFDRPVTP